MVGADAGNHKATPLLLWPAIHLYSIPVSIIMLSILRNLYCVYAARHRPLLVNNETIGYVSHVFAEKHLSRGSLFDVQDKFVALEGSCDELSLRLAVIKGWREETYAAVRIWGEKPRFLIERAAAGLYGLRTYGVHLNVFYKHPQDGMQIFISRRSLSKPTFT